MKTCGASFKPRKVPNLFQLYSLVGSELFLNYLPSNLKMKSNAIIVKIAVQKCYKFLFEF